MLKDSELTRAGHRMSSDEKPRILKERKLIIVERNGAKDAMHAGVEEIPQTRTLFIFFFFSVPQLPFLL
jgi:hypothetical protein